MLDNVSDRIYIQGMDSTQIEQFGKIIRGFVRCHRDKRSNRLFPDPIPWLARKMNKSDRTIENFLSNPTLMNLDTRALMARVLREELDIYGSVDLMVELIDSVPGK